tara:strand:- start:224 stop:385 length:162 start_codon:yes stop_codon:yes gene_type:complete
VNACSAGEPQSIQAQVQTDKWAEKWWMPRHEKKLLVKDQMEKVDLVFNIFSHF